MRVKPLRAKKEFDNVRSMVEEIGSLYEGKVAYRYRIKPRDKEAVCVKYEELRDQVRGLGTEMTARGLAGKKIILIGKHSFEWILVYYATLATGSVLIPLDKDWAKEDLLDTVRTAEADYLFCDADILEKGKFITDELGFPAPIVVHGEGEECVNAWKASGLEKFKADSAPYFANPIDVDALALLVFTSGTTGQGKGVMLSQRNFMSDLADVVQYIDFSVKCMNVLPPHHTYGSSVSIYGQNSIGCDVYISSGIKYVADELRDHKPGHLVAVPLYVETFYRKILSGISSKSKLASGFVKTLMKINHAAHKIGMRPFDGFFRKQILANFGGELNMIISGGAPLNQEMADLFDSIGVTVLNGYGITECAPIIAVNHNNYIVPKSVGPVLPIDTVRIDEPNEDGEGEIQVKGPNVMLGYYKNEEATADAFTEDGWFRTGDIGYEDADGYFYITGRMKSVIVLENGKNVFPEEIEEYLGEIDTIAECAVIGREDGEVVNLTALIYPDLTKYSEETDMGDIQEDIEKSINAMNKTLPTYKQVKIVELRTVPFEKTSSRKIKRHLLK